MDVGLAIAGLISVALAVGHTTIGLVWVLPSITEEHLPGTPFGRPSMTVAMVRVTWYIVTIFALGSGGILMTLAWAAAADPGNGPAALVHCDVACCHGDGDMGL